MVSNKPRNAYSGIKTIDSRRMTGHHDHVTNPEMPTQALRRSLMPIAPAISSLVTNPEMPTQALRQAIRIFRKYPLTSNKPRNAYSGIKTSLKIFHLSPVLQPTQAVKQKRKLGVRSELDTKGRQKPFEIDKTERVSSHKPRNLPFP